MATPAMQAQTMQLTLVRGATRIYTSAPVLDGSGDPVDFTSGSWVHRIQYRPLNANMAAASTTLSSGVTITGDAAGILTLTIAAAAASAVVSLNGSFFVQSSNDALSTASEPINGNFSVSPIDTIG